MRSVFVLFVFILASASLRAQEQEGQLIDRLLRPDLTLQNSAQNKHFTTGNNSVGKRARTGSFYVAKKGLTKTFAGVPKVSEQQYATDSYRGGSAVAFVETQNELSKQANLEARDGGLKLRTAYGNDRKVSTRKFAGNRPFLDKGKSQKAISRRQEPLTIEQVRELLNRNK